MLPKYSEYASTRFKEDKMEFKDYELEEFLSMGEGDPEKEKIEEEIYGKGE